MIPLPPSAADLRWAEWLSRLLGHWQFFDQGVESAIRHNVLGGLWFAASLFQLWSRGGEESTERYRRVLMAVLASAIAIGLVLGVHAATLRTPPNRNPALAHLYPSYLMDNPNQNCFPSMSSALYGSIAAVAMAASRLWGTLLWVALLVLVALPRMYLGGHYTTDVLAGIALGLAGCVLARRFDRRYGEALGTRLARLRRWRPAFAFVVFLWIWQVAVEFRDADWLQRSLRLAVSTYMTSRR